MKQVKVLFGTDYELTWNVLEHKPASIWFQMLEKEMIGGRNFLFRYPGLKPAKLSDLQNHIDVINEDGRYKISDKTDQFDQEFSNKIHHHFEILSGSYDQTTEYYKESSEIVKAAVDGLNHCVHDLEAWHRNQMCVGTEHEKNVFSAVVLEIRNCNRIHMPGAFHKYFTMNLEFGDIVLHYSQIGKTWLEAFYDNDQDIFDEGIRPQFALSGEFDIFFGSLHPDEVFLEKLRTYLQSKGKDLHDPELRLGHLPVARLELNEDWKTLKQEISFRNITRIRTFSDDLITSEKKF